MASLEFSIFLAQAWGLYLAVVSSALLVNRNNLKIVFHSYQTEEAPFYSGFIVLIVGILMILSHQVWTGDWRTIITLLGWIAFIKGVIRLIWPSLVVEMTKQLRKSQLITGCLIFTMMLGVYLVLITLTV